MTGYYVLYNGMAGEDFAPAGADRGWGMGDGGRAHTKLVSALRTARTPRHRTCGLGPKSV